MGRIADVGVTVFVGGLIYLTGVSYMTAFISELILLTILIALMFSENLLKEAHTVATDTAGAGDRTPVERIDPVIEYSLTPREKEVFEILVSTEKKNQEIADELGISRRQLQNHISSIYNKTGAQSRAGLTQLTKN